MRADISIIGQDDPPPWEGLPGRIDHHVMSGTRWAILQAGMQSGRPSVGILVPLEDDATVPGALRRYAFVEVSYAIFESVAAAFRGAVARWEEQSRNEGPMIGERW
jgi:hypothetical protein